MRGAGGRRIAKRTMMSAHLYTLFIVLGAVGLVSGEVKESRSSYSCCGSPSVEFYKHCENSWSINDMTIAYSRGESRRCKSPCKKIEDGLMMLDACVDVNMTAVCTIEMDVIEEKMIHYHGQLCPRTVSHNMAPGSQGSVGLLVLSVIAGLLMK